MKSKNKLNNAFSLIELSIVILIIGILVTGITQSSRLVRQMKISTAQSLTRSSPVPNRNLMFWWETSLEESFLSGEASEGNEITQWNDSNPLTTMKIHGYRGQKTTVNTFNYDFSGFSSARGPSYVADGINSLPSLRFFNSGSAVYMQTDSKFKNSGNENLLMFLVIRYRSGTGWIVDRVCQNPNGSGNSIGCASSRYLGLPLFGLALSGLTLEGIVRDNVNAATINSNANAGTFISSQTPFIVAVERKYRQTVSTYLNGKLSTSVTDNQGIANIDMVKLGRHEINTSDNLNFDISEFIYYVGSIANEDRDAIEDYLGKKYNIKIAHQ
jgi:prepilin-type N-terminal cleavage/methylation domain-containing protein